jgi:glycosyltransferase involved in cell wall biosynthesis
MLAHLRRRQAFLRRADAVIACSPYIADRLAGIVLAERLHVIPHLVDLPAIDRAVAAPPQSVAPGERFVLFVGKLERNKGAHLLLDVYRELGSRAQQMPMLVIAGNGPLRGALEHGLASLGAPARFLDWADHDEVLRLTARCELLLFPSAWGEPLSRVLLEACACRAPILAMPTGGTPDIIEDGASGALAATPARFARRMAELLSRPEERRVLGEGARLAAEARLAKERVAEQVEALYDGLIRDRHGAEARGPRT